MSENQHNDLETWQIELRDSFRKPADLLNFLKLEKIISLESGVSKSPFPLFVTRSFAERMKPSDPQDPLFLQVWPQKTEEDNENPNFLKDPVGDLKAFAGPGLIQKYKGRALYLPTALCAIHCRYCFRRHFPADKISSSRELPDLTRHFLEAHPEIEEIILSGGDPLMRNDEQLRILFQDLAQFPHLKRIRIHSRLPLVLPARITNSLMNVFKKFESHFQYVWVVHCNHPNEINPEVCHSIHRIRQAGHILLNQSVLLRGINDTSEILGELSKKLFELGIIPYYLHQLDRVQGAAHFEVSENTGQKIITQLMESLPGYLVPRYVREDAGEKHKTPLQRKSSCQKTF